MKAVLLALLVLVGCQSRQASKRPDPRTAALEAEIVKLRQQLKACNERPSEENIEESAKVRWCTLTVEGDRCSESLKVCEDTAEVFGGRTCRRDP